eukprot:c39025_g1_i1 orf=89-289(+)
MTRTFFNRNHASSKVINTKPHIPSHLQHALFLKIYLHALLGIRIVYFDAFSGKGKTQIPRIQSISE